MKKITLVRHAKSSWANSFLDDAERPLNKRGQRDAPFMAKVISTLIEKPDVIVTSHAVRAFETAKIIATQFSFSERSIHINEEIYLPDVGDLVKFIAETQSSYDHIALVGHNPSLTELTNILTNSEIENVPTCGIIHIEFRISRWEEVYANKGKIVLFEYPKKYL